MKLKLLLPTLIVSLIIGCSPNSGTTNQEAPRAFKHLQYLFNLKNEVASAQWKDFAKYGSLPLVYFTKGGTYVINPNDHIKSSTKYEEVEIENFGETIRLSAEYLDTTNFHFYTSFSDTDSSALYFQESVLFFQSFELTRKFIPDIVDLQDWSIMVIHELFHGYQVSVPEHRVHFMNIDIPGGPDAFLGTYHGVVDWFKEGVYQENEILKSIWMDGADLASGLNRFDSLGTLRIDRIKNEYDTDIREVEDYELMIEGNARYFEGLCKRHLSTTEPNTDMLDESDQIYLTGMFENYDIKKDKALSNPSNNRYYYPMGYNISMILEKYSPDFRETIYKEKQSLIHYLDELHAN